MHSVFSDNNVLKMEEGMEIYNGKGAIWWKFNWAYDIDYVGFPWIWHQVNLNVPLHHY